MSAERGSRKLREGTIVSDKMDKTVVVSVDRTIRHPRYGKFVRVRRKYKAHDETNDGKIGDLVRIEETRPLSKDKRWKLKTVLERAKT